MTTAPLFLVADIGGTNTRAALSDGTQVRRDTIIRFRNADYDNIAPVLQAYLAGRAPVELAGVCVALAGPVSQKEAETHAQMTNLSWDIDTATLRDVSGAPRAAILNDLQAQAYALPYLAPGDITRLFGPAPQANATQLVLGVGTGFNAAVSIVDGPGRRVVPASESGHISLPVRTELDWRLAKSVARHHDFAAVEDVLSGRGLERVHAFLADEFPGSAPLEAADIVSQAPSDPHAKAAIDLFTTVLGRIAGDLGLIHLPFGGIYLVGGVARATSPFAMQDLGAQAFRDKGRFADFMNQFSVHLVSDDYAALVGCAGRLMNAPLKSVIG